MKSIEWLEEKLKISLGNELEPLRGFFVIAKEMYDKEIDESRLDGYGEGYDEGVYDRENK